MSNIPLTEDEIEQIRARIGQLELEHGDLNGIIDRIGDDRVLDSVRLRRLKKRRLLLKDQIARLRARLIPDIIA